MDRLIIASNHKSAGKTSVIVGLANALGKRTGYMKPFGDRLLYRKKRLWDYDAALVTSIFSLTQNPEEMSMGFVHSKLLYMYNESMTKTKLLELADSVGKDKDVLLVECGQDLAFGMSVFLDPISLAKNIGGGLVIVVCGDEGKTLDDIAFIKKHMTGVDLRGVIINKVHDLEDFKGTYLNRIQDMGVKVLGIIPHKSELTYLPIEYLAENLFAKVVAGEAGMKGMVKNIFVGAMSGDAALHTPAFKKDKKLIITSGDRTDMLLAALESDTACILMTNNMLPPANVISIANEKNIPLLLVSFDTFDTARKIDAIEPLLTKNDKERVQMLTQMVTDSVDLKAVLGK
jgi:uncharacterized protein